VCLETPVQTNSAKVATRCPETGSVDPAVKIESIPHYFRKRADGNVVIQFVDGDRYPLFRLDLWGENDEGEYEIIVKFEDCLGDSRTPVLAVGMGPERFPYCWWTSRPPREPVGMTYTLADIESIHDLDSDHCVYTRQAETP
jgi:hypothetical protein